jgi:hypothetical protein
MRLVTLLASALSSVLDVSVTISEERQSMYINGFKVSVFSAFGQGFGKLIAVQVSGSAFRIARNTAFHHCTLLYDANLPQLERCLQPSLVGNLFVSVTFPGRWHAHAAAPSSLTYPVSNHDLQQAFAKLSQRYGL